MNEAQISQEILRALCGRDDLRIWRSNSGSAFTPDGRRVKFGIDGQADFTGIRRGGQRVEIEVKSLTGRQSPEQSIFGNVIRTFSGLYILARSAKDVIDALDRGN